MFYHERYSLLKSYLINIFLAYKILVEEDTQKEKFIFFYTYKYKKK